MIEFLIRGKDTMNEYELKENMKNEEARAEIKARIVAKRGGRR